MQPCYHPLQIFTLLVGHTTLFCKPRYLEKFGKQCCPLIFLVKPYSPLVLLRCFEWITIDSCLDLCLLHFFIQSFAIFSVSSQGRVKCVQQVCQSLVTDIIGRFPALALSALLALGTFSITHKRS